MKKKNESKIAVQLAEAIKQSRKPDKPWCDGVLENVDIKLEIKGYGRVPLPMRPADVREMSSVAKPAPFGKGTKTLVDEKVRDTLEIDASQIGFSDKFAEAIKGAKEEVAEQLQLETGRLKIELYKLLIYPQGGFFLPHRDSEKRRGMVATMVVVLPSRFGGGELALQHAKHRKSYSFDQASKQQYPQFAAFYADCRHEVKRVTSGVRMCLAFNLVLTPERKSTTSCHGVDSALQRQVKAWVEHRPADPLLFALEHQYTEAGLKVSQLKGADKELHRNISAVAESLDCELFFGQVERHLCQEAYPETRHHYRRGYRTGFGHWSGDYNDLEITGIIDDVIVVDGWRQTNGKKAKLHSLACEFSQVISHIPAEDWIPTKADYEDYTGNAGNTLDRWYHKSVIAI